MRPLIRPNRLATACFFTLATLGIPYLSAAPAPAPTAPAAGTATQPMPQAAPATRPSDGDPIPPNDIRVNFKDVPLDVVLHHLSQAAGLIVVKEAPVDGNVTVMSERPVSAQDAVMLLDTVLKANGFTAIRNGKILRIVSRDKAKKGDIPVHFGDDPAQIASTDQLITQVIPIKNVDAVKLRDDLRPLIGTDADIAANGGSNAIVITDNSANIKRIAEIISLLDKREDQAGSVIKVIQLKNASASSAARLIMSIFHPPERDRGKPQQGKAPPPPPQEKALGNGVDQALNGGKVMAAADDRTNTLVVAGPAATLTIIQNMVQELDANPAVVVVIHSFHLKVADSESVSRLITAVFDTEGTNQIRGAGQGPMRAHVTAVPEYRTNTVIVTAPTSVMTVIEGLVKELESNPSGEATYRSFHLKYADATTTADALGQILNHGRRRYGPGNLERVNVTADVRTNTVIVTGPSEELHKAEGIIKDLDANPADGTQTKFFHLKMADAESAAKMIDTFFNPPSQRRQAQSGLLPLHDLLRHVGISAQADQRSNTVIVTAPAEAMKTVDQLMEQIEKQPWVDYDIRSYSLNYADADVTAKLISTVFAPDPQQANQAPGKAPSLRTRVVAASDERTNTVVVTAPPDSLKVIDALVKLLDSNPGTAEDMKVFPLQYADAGAAAILIESMFPQPNGSGSSGRRSSYSSSSPPPNMPKMPVVIAAADERTNTLVVTAPADALKVVSTLVKQLDSNPASKQTFFIYRLRNGQSADMAYVMNQLFENGAAGVSPNTSGPSSQSRNGQRSSSQLAGFGSNSRGFGSQSGGFRSRSNSSSSSYGRSGSSAYGYGSSSQIPAGVGQVASELAGQVLVVADPDTNSLLVTTASRYELQVRQIIAELDRPVPQVLIKVLVAEVTHDNNADFGTDFSILNTRPNGNGQTFGQSFGKPSGGLVVSFVESNLNATLHALAQQNKLDVLSRPYILASDNQEANVLVGQEVPIVTSNYTTALGQTVSNYQYQDVGIMLDVTPHINPDGLVTLDVSPQISQLTSQTVNVGPGVNVPVIAARTASSRVAIHDGQTIVIGGLMQDQKTLTVNKIPILGDIPILGYIFSRTVVDKTKTELLIFLTPHVAQQPEDLDSMSKDEMKGTRLTPNAVAPGTFDEHLRGMQRGEAPTTGAASQPVPPALEFRGEAEPTTQPEPQTIHLPIH